MTDKQIGFGRFFVQEAIRAGTWGAAFLLVMAILITAMKQDIKEGIAYGVDRLVSEMVFASTNRVLVGDVKQLVKKGIDYTVMKAAQGAREVLIEKNTATKSQTQSTPEASASRPRRQ